MLNRIIPGDQRPYYSALRNPRNRKSGKRIYLNQIIRQVAKDELKKKAAVN
jgi:hypothetical protein